ncbi:MAG: pyruvate formate lyase-activating protein [Clostridia bacterium]|nr:pyruvate formate lyase-activating protein [Clostridia bacterium]MBR2893558.1 pyruvate formate lyase-activating protein [Clostridia bacterium]
MTGYIHSIESFGTVDGPGIRFVVFLQGCPLRCKFCHNPDTWAMGQGTEMTSDELIDKYMKNRAFYSRGGITVTGGEPLMQLDFITELFTKAKRYNIHTCIDTSGITYREDDAEYINKLRRLIAVTDLVMLDIKHMDSQKHKDLTGADGKNILAFAKFLEKTNVDLCIRHVVIEGITDNADNLRDLGRFIGKLKNLRWLDVLPYHTLGVNKYEQLGISYPLEGTEPTTKEKAIEAKGYIMEGIKEARSKR